MEYKLKPKKDIKRLIADIPTALHNEARIQGVLYGISMKDYIIRAIMEKIAKDEAYRKGV